MHMLEKYFHSLCVACFYNNKIIGTDVADDNPTYADLSGWGLADLNRGKCVMVTG